MARKLFLNLLIVLFACFCVNATWAQNPDDTWNNDELFKGYIQKVFDEALPQSKQPKKTARRSAKESLVGNDLVLYNLLKTKIQQVAAGTITNTQFSIPISELGPIKTSWTASELGVGAFTSDNLMGYVNANFTINYSKVIHALLEDFPYDLYWYDKTKGCQFGTGSISWNSSVFDIKGPITFNMYVSANYSADGNKGTFNTNATRPTRVGTALTTAQNVVTAHASEPLLQKLVSYRQYICNNVTYNSAAAGSSSTPYGDPWQLVYVFDGDAGTNVVCEGYSKAFKYLCDLSNFTDAECLLATGYMTGGTGAGSHMWNVMRMDDGRNYLVDVTNCDDGTIGAPDNLFMAYDPSGSYDTYYVFSIGSGIIYQYDNETKSSLGEQALTISTSAYSAPGIKVTLNDNGNIATQLEDYRGVIVNVNYKRPNLTPQKPVTVCLPFSYPIGSEGTYYTFTGVTKVGNVMQANMTANVTGTLEANTPYLFVPAENIYTVDYSGSRFIPETAIIAGSEVSGRWTFQGVYERKTWAASGNDYGFAAYGGVATDGTTEVKAGDFVRAASGASVNAMRCYLTYNPSSDVRTRGDDDITELPERITVVLHNSEGATTIGEIDLRNGEVTIDDDIWFDLTGRRLNGKPTQKGIYFNKGHKVIMK